MDRPTNVGANSFAVSPSAIDHPAGISGKVVGANLFAKGARNKANKFAPTRPLRDIHVELADLNREAPELAARIQENFEELGV